jgi:hypothetical protein
MSATSCLVRWMGPSWVKAVGILLQIIILQSVLLCSYNISYITQETWPWGHTLGKAMKHSRKKAFPSLHVQTLKCKHTEIKREEV